MTIQPNNQAPKFQDPAETPTRTEDPRKPDGLDDNGGRDDSRKADSLRDNADRDGAVRNKAVKNDTTKDNSVRDRSARDDAARDRDTRTGTAQAETSRTGAMDGRHGRSDVDSPADETKSPETAIGADKADKATVADKATAARRATDQDTTTAPQNQAPVAARTRLFEEHDVTRFREQWRELQAGFVDEPRGAVREADTLVSQMMDSLTAQLNEQKRALQGDSEATDTEQLRVALQRYRSLFDQMLQV